MPIYDYVCATCRHLTEVIHGIHDPGPRYCPACGADGTMRKTLSTPAVHFKGSGWAKKDRSSASAARTKAASAASSGAAGAGDGSGAAPAAEAAAPSDTTSAGTPATTED